MLSKLYAVRQCKSSAEFVYKADVCVRRLPFLHVAGAALEAAQGCLQEDPSSQSQMRVATLNPALWSVACAAVQLLMQRHPGGAPLLRTCATVFVSCGCADC
jgi:hypothetical protein